MPWGPQPSIQCDYVTGTLGALNAELVLSLFSASTATIQVTGTWSGTLTFEFSNNNFQTTHPAFFSSPTVGLINTTTANGNFRVYGPAGYLAFRAKMTAYSSGSATATLTAALGNSTQVTLASGLFQDAEVPIFYKPLLMGGVDTVDSSARSVKVTPTGLVKMDGSSVTQPVSGPLTDTQLRATPVPISGTVTITDGAGAVNVILDSGVVTSITNAVAVTGTFWQATQPISIASMPSTPVTGTFWQATQPVSGPLTDTQLRLTPVPISGVVSLGLTGQTLKRAVVALSATWDVIAAVPTKKLKVYQYAVQSRADNMTAQFRDGAAGSLLGLRWGINSREGATSAPINPPATLFATTAGNALQAVISGSGTVDIEVSYWDDDVT